MTSSPDPSSASTSALARNPSPPSSDARNGVSSDAATSLPPSDPNAAAADAQSRIREGKAKAKAVMAASGVAVTDDGDNRAVNASPGSRSPAGDAVNGVATSRKRSRSGSRIPSNPPPQKPADHPQPGINEFLINHYYKLDELGDAALCEATTKRQLMNTRQLQERDYYRTLRMPGNTPAQIYGYGYAGFGNGTSDGPPQIVYPDRRKRVGGRRELRVSRKDMKNQADQVEELVPIRVEVEMDKLKLRDTFTWNLHDRVIPPEQFASTLVEDFSIPPQIAPHVAQQVARDINDQLQDHYPHVFIEEEPLDPHLPYSAYKDDDMRILVKLNITIGKHTLVDQFEWDINNPLNNPEDFARSMARDLSLSGEFVTAIAHSIREQCQLFTRSLYITGHPFDGRPIEDPDIRESFLPSPLPTVFRPVQSSKDYAPYLYELNESDLQREELAMMRDQRRQKRSTNRRGGPALPDLKERQRTVRSLIISSVLPGAADSLETSRLYRVPRSSGRRGRAPGARVDGIDESDESDSDESVMDSPALSNQPLPGTSRTRGMRGAASAAAAALRGNLGRSATPEVSALHHHETRTSARRIGTVEREESVAASAAALEDQTKLIVRLKIGKDRFRQWLRSYKPGASTRATSAAGEGTPAAETKSVDRSAAPKFDVENIKYHPDGRVDAPYPAPAGNPKIPPPPWIGTALTALRQRYPHDRFDAFMKYSSVNATTNAVEKVEIPPGGQPPAHIKFQWLPRVRCEDCPNKFYNVGPGESLDNFEVHLKNRLHKEAVQGRLRAQQG